MTSSFAESSGMTAAFEAAANGELLLPGQYVRRTMPLRHPISEDDVAV
jgi:hypothetical protein